MKKVLCLAILFSTIHCAKNTPANPESNNSKSFQTDAAILATGYFTIDQLQFSNRIMELTRAHQVNFSAESKKVHDRLETLRQSVSTDDTGSKIRDSLTALETLKLEYKQLPDLLEGKQPQLDAQFPASLREAINERSEICKNGKVYPNAKLDPAHGVTEAFLKNLYKELCVREHETEKLSLVGAAISAHENEKFEDVEKISKNETLRKGNHGLGYFYAVTNLVAIPNRPIQNIADLAGNHDYNSCQTLIREIEAALNAKAVDPKK